MFQVEDGRQLYWKKDNACYAASPQVAMPWGKDESEKVPRVCCDLNTMIREKMSEGRHAGNETRKPRCKVHVADEIKSTTQRIQCEGGGGGGDKDNSVWKLSA